MLKGQATNLLASYIFCIYDILYYTELVFEAQSLLGRGVINKGYFSEAFLFKPRGRRSPPSGLNRKQRKNSLFGL